MVRLRSVCSEQLHHWCFSGMKTRGGVIREGGCPGDDSAGSCPGRRGRGRRCRAGAAVLAFSFVPLAASSPSSASGLRLRRRKYVMMRRPTGHGYHSNTHSTIHTLYLVLFVALLNLRVIISLPLRRPATQAKERDRV